MSYGVYAAATALLLTVMASACTSEQPPSIAPPGDQAPAASPVDIPNAATPFDGVLTGGAPTDAQLQELKEKGYRTIVDLRTEAEGTRAEGQKVARLGMGYVPIPMRGAADLTLGNARMLSVVLADPTSRPALVHCRSGNRVGALIAYMAFHIDGKSAAEALALGRRAGLTSLEGAVREVLK